MKHYKVDDISFQEKLAKAIKDKFTNQEEFAKSIGVKQATVSKYLSGNILPSFQVLQKIYQVLEFSNHTGESFNENNILIKHYHSAVSAGEGLEVLDNHAEHIYFDKRWIENIFALKTAKGLFTTKAKGDSMEPLIYEGDIIFAKIYKGNNFTQGLYIVEYNDDYFVKKLQFKSPSLIKLIPANSDYDPIEVNLTSESTSFRIIAHVVGTLAIKNFPHGYNT